MKETNFDKEQLLKKYAILSFYLKHLSAKELFEIILLIKHTIMDILNKEKPLLDLNEYYVIESKFKDDYNRYFKYHITKEEIQEGR